MSPNKFQTFFVPAKREALRSCKVVPCEDVWVFAAAWMAERAGMPDERTWSSAIAWVAMRGWVYPAGHGS